MNYPSKRMLLLANALACLLLFSACGENSDSLDPDQGNDNSAEEQNQNTHDHDDSDGMMDDAHSDNDSHQNTDQHAHHCMMEPEFVEQGLATHTAVQSGAWSDPATWGGDIPGEASFVLIPENLEVSINQELAARHETVRIDGRLAFSSTQDTELKVDTLFSACSGALLIGDTNSPVAANVSAKVVFIDDGPVTDTKRLSRGAILMGETSIYGSSKTHRAVISPQAQAGDIQLTLSEAPMGWQVGDELVITGTVFNNPMSDEVRFIASISDQQVTLNEPLEFDHRAPRSGLNVYVANTSRNVEFVSESTSLLHRGHIMLMSADVDIQNVRFTELGRTDKTEPLDDVEFAFDDDSNGDDAPATAEVIPLGGENVRGRYALHFHRNGTDVTSEPALVQGSVVFNGPGWGFVNHSSHVDFVDNVAYGLQGAGFYTEAGDEIGRMQGNIAIRSVNASFTLDDQGAIDPDLGASRMDYGNDGDGFWLTGTRVSLIDNVSAGASAHGFIYWTDGIMEADSTPAVRASIPVSNLPNGQLIPGRESVPVWWAPLAESRCNESYGATIGFRSRYVHAKNYLGREEQSDFHRSPPQAYIDTLNPVVEDLTVWGNRDGVLLNYNERMSLEGARIVGPGRELSQFSFNDGTAKSGIGLDIGNPSTHGPARVRDVTIEGFGMGFVAPVNGQWNVSNLSLSENDTDMLFQEVETDGTQIRFDAVQYESFQVADDEASTELPAHVLVR